MCLVNAVGTCGQSSEIFCRLRHRFVEELNEDGSGGNEVDGDVEKYDRPPLDLILTWNS